MSEYWPTAWELAFADKIGHQLDPERQVCSCGYRPDQPALTPRLQLANHVWTSIEKHRLSLERWMTGRTEITEEQEIIDLAETLGHTANFYRDKCSCGKQGAWFPHAKQAIDEALHEIERAGKWQSNSGSKT